MNLDADIMIADGAQYTVRQTHFAFGNFNAGSGDGISNVAGTDRTKQLAFIASFRGDGDAAKFINFIGASMGGSQNISQFSFQLNVTRFKNFDVFLGRRSGETFRYQEITGVTRFNANLIA